MFGLGKDQEQIIRLAETAQRLITELHINEPDNETFEQTGIINGFTIIKEFIDTDEVGLALEHLLYMIYESDIFYPESAFQELHNLTSKYKIDNFYVA